MKNYKKVFLVASIIISIPSLFLFMVGVINFSVSHLLFWGGMLSAWWGSYIYLYKDKKFSFWCSFILINLFWWPLLAQSAIRIQFIIKNGGMERADGYGSPLAFLIGLVGEQLFFISLSVVMVYGFIVIKNSNKKIQRT